MGTSPINARVPLVQWEPKQQTDPGDEKVNLDLDRQTDRQTKNDRKTFCSAVLKN